MFVAPPFVAGAVLAAILLLYWNVFLLVFVVLVFCLAAFAAYFFRDPERVIGKGVVSPADGKIMKADKEGEELHIVVFMNVDDVHVNRAPLDCTVKAMKRSGTGYEFAFNENTDTNVRLEWALETSAGAVRMHQVTGWFARRIVPYASEGATLKKGERLGMIRFGSRVEVWLPAAHFSASVSKGDRVKAGASTIAMPATGGKA